MDEIRNELLYIRTYTLAKEEEKSGWLDILLERFKIDLERKKENLENELKHTNDNLELLELVKNQIKEGVEND